MSQENSGQVIQVPNTLRLKVGGRFGAIDPGALMALSRLGQGAPELTDAVWAALTTSWGGATDRPEQMGEP